MTSNPEVVGLANKPSGILVVTSPKPVSGQSIDIGSSVATKGVSQYRSGFLVERRVHGRDLQCDSSVRIAHGGQALPEWAAACNGVIDIRRGDNRAGVVWEIDERGVHEFV